MKFHCKHLYIKVNKYNTRKLENYFCANIIVQRSCIEKNDYYCVKVILSQITVNVN